MAKEKKQLTPEEKKREKERKEREKKEYADLKKKQKEKEKRQKRREKRRKKKEKEELRRIKKKINFPYKILFNMSALITLLVLIILLYIGTFEPQEIVFYTFLVFFLCYGGGGIAMVSIFYLISLDKEKELEEEIRHMAESEKEEEEKREAELEELEHIQKEIENRRKEEIENHKKLPDKAEEENKSQAESEESEESEELEGHMLPEFEMEDVTDFGGADEDQQIFSELEQPGEEQQPEQQAAEIPLPEEPQNSDENQPEEIDINEKAEKE
jgi:ABC-type multidrug transport system fused ATPase/permease subunit